MKSDLRFPRISSPIILNFLSRSPRNSSTAAAKSVVAAAADVPDDVSAFPIADVGREMPGFADDRVGLLRFAGVCVVKKVPLGIMSSDDVTGHRLEEMR